MHLYDGHRPISIKTRVRFETGITDSIVGGATQMRDCRLTFGDATFKTALAIGHPINRRVRSYLWWNKGRKTSSCNEAHLESYSNSISCPSLFPKDSGLLLPRTMGALLL